MQPNNPFRNARWIGTDRFALPVICREFSTGLLENATLFITGLGYFEARLNGQPLTRERLLPPVSDYEPRDPTKFLYPLTDRPTNRIYYCEFDVTDLRNTLTDGGYTAREGYIPISLQYRPYTAATARPGSIGQGDFRL